MKEVGLKNKMVFTTAIIVSVALIVLYFMLGAGALYVMLTNSTLIAIVIGLMMFAFIIKLIK